MSNDAKLGLVVGIGVVILIAILFFRKETGPSSAAEAKVPAKIQPVTTAVAPPASDSFVLPSSPRPPAARDPEPLAGVSRR
jgi:hypothetical protein